MNNNLLKWIIIAAFIVFITAIYSAWLRGKNYCNRILTIGKVESFQPTVVDNKIRTPSRRIIKRTVESAKF